MAVVGKGSRTANASRVAQGTEDVNFTLPNNSDDIILGTGVGDDNADEMEAGFQVRLQFRTGADAFTNVVSGSGAVRLGLTDLVEGNALTSGERLSTGLFGSFVNGVEVETTNPSSQANDVIENTTEFQWSLDFNFAVANTQYDFRVGWTSGVGEDFINYISITTALVLSIPVAMNTYRRLHQSWS